MPTKETEATPDETRASDGTEFAIHSEHVRGEPRWYGIWRREVGASSYVTDGVYDGSVDKRTVRRRMMKRVAEWEATHA